LYFRSQQIKVAHIPCVEAVCACLEGARSDQPVINCSAHNSQRYHATDGRTVLVAIKPYQGQLALNFLYEQGSVLSVNRCLPGYRVSIA
jgi:hypothetical protein